MQIETTIDEKSAHQFSHSEAVERSEQFNRSHHNNSMQVEYDHVSDKSVIGLYDSDYEFAGYLAVNPWVT